MKAELTSTRREQGFSIIENLVAVALVGIALVGATGLVINAMHGNSAARTYSALMGDVQAKMDEYRQLSFGALLANIGPDPSAIGNGQSATVSTSSSTARATYVTTFTAIKNNPTGVPQAVKIKVDAIQRRGAFGNATYSFETLIANVS